MRKTEQEKERIGTEENERNAQAQNKQHFARLLLIFLFESTIAHTHTRLFASRLLVVRTTFREAQGRKSKREAARALVAV